VPQALTGQAPRVQTGQAPRDLRAASSRMSWSICGNEQRKEGRTYAYDYEDSVLRTLPIMEANPGRSCGDVPPVGSTAGVHHG